MLGSVVLFALGYAVAHAAAQVGVFEWGLLNTVRRYGMPTLGVFTNRMHLASAKHVPRMRRGTAGRVSTAQRHLRVFRRATLLPHCLGAWWCPDDDQHWHRPDQAVVEGRPRTRREPPADDRRLPKQQRRCERAWLHDDEYVD